MVGKVAAPGTGSEWVLTDTTLVLDSGIAVAVSDVKAVRDAGGKLYVDPVSALSSYYAARAAEAGIVEVRDAALLSMLVAPIGGMSAAWVLRKYSLNKMLFYQWQRAVADGLGDAFPHDEFVAERKGPVPIHIDSDLDRLEAAGLINVKRHDPQVKEHQPWVISLTPAGEERARRFFNVTEGWFRRVTISTKRDLLLLDPAKLQARVHSEYPNYRRKYVEIDDS